MRERILSVLIVILSSVHAADAGILLGASTGQKIVDVINATPYVIPEFSLWMDGVGTPEEAKPTFGWAQPIPNLVLGRLARNQRVRVYVDQKACVIHAIAWTREGRLFSKDLNICTHPGIWIITSGIDI